MPARGWGLDADFVLVFHYEFKALGEDKVHTMMWDYNIGLVRTTPLFKCTGYSKVSYHGGSGMLLANVAHCGIDDPCEDAEPQSRFAGDLS